MYSQTPIVTFTVLESVSTGEGDEEGGVGDCAVAVCVEVGACSHPADYANVTNDRIESLNKKGLLTIQRISFYTLGTAEFNNHYLLHKD